MAISESQYSKAATRPVYLFWNGEFVLDNVTQDEAEAFKRKQIKSSQDVFDVIFPRLKAMSEKQ